MTDINDSHRLRAQLQIVQEQRDALRADNLALTLARGRDQILIGRLKEILAAAVRAGGELSMSEINDALSSSRHTLANPPENSLGVGPGDEAFAAGAAYMRSQIACLEDVRRMIVEERS